MTLIDRLRDALALPDADDGWHGDDRPYADPARAVREAAVLIAFTDRPEPGVILTQRPQWLRDHAGQVAFPGGKVEDADPDVVAAALREADEEIGLSPRAVTIAGTGRAYRTATGFNVTPVLGVVAPDVALDPNPDEVDAAFEVPASILFDPARYRRQQAVWKGHLRTFFELDWDERRIWGATAGIILNLATRLPWRG